MLRFTQCLGMLIALAAFAGCGESGGKARLSGKVSWKGAPLSYGSIFFDTEGVKEMAAIRDGKYEIALPAGSYTIRIISSQAVEGKKDEMGMQLGEQIIPKKYNSESELKVTLDKSKEQNFDLTQ